MRKKLEAEPEGFGEPAQAHARGDARSTPNALLQYCYGGTAGVVCVVAFLSLSLSCSLSDRSSLLACQQCNLHHQTTQTRHKSERSIRVGRLEIQQELQAFTQHNISPALLETKPEEKKEKKSKRKEEANEENGNARTQARTHLARSQLNVQATVQVAPTRDTSINLFSN